MMRPLFLLLLQRKRMIVPRGIVVVIVRQQLREGVPVLGRGHSVVVVVAGDAANAAGHGGFGLSHGFVHAVAAG